MVRGIANRTEIWDHMRIYDHNTLNILKFLKKIKKIKTKFKYFEEIKISKKFQIFIKFKKNIDLQLS